MNRSCFDTYYPIMEEAFPEIERRNREGQRALLSLDCYRLRLASQGGRTVGFIAWWELERCRFIEHVATLPEVRGGGIGRALILTAARSSKLPVVLEIEPPADALTRRRAAMYERLGFVQNPFPYLQPPLQEGFSPIPLVLMSCREPLGKAQFDAIREELHRRVYGQNTALD